MPRRAPHVEPPLLRRLRQAVQTSGMTADPSALTPDEQQLVVTNRLAQTTVRYLASVSPTAARLVEEELRALGSSEEFEVLMADRSFTFFHLVQFLYELAKHHADLPDFCLGMGRGGGGVEVAPDREVVSLIGLLSSAMPPGDESQAFGLFMRSLSPGVLTSVFASGLFTFEVEPTGARTLGISLRYADRVGLETPLKALGLGADLGALFLNTALHVQGALELGCGIMAQDAATSVRLAPPVQDRPLLAREAIARDCTCTWALHWNPDLRLSRLMDPMAVIDRGMIVLEALHRKDVQYYLERIRRLETRVRTLEEGDQFHQLIGGSPVMQRVYQTIGQVATTDFPVLIRGESGTGKELAARAIHASGPRRDRPFVAVNCAAFAEALLESELFGHERGAFTGADRQRAGRFEAAHGGTLFLDEVGDVPLTTQVKLLRVLDNQVFERVGGSQSLQVDVRIIAATNRDLEALIAQGRFREDFYFRLNVLPLRLPPLREHPEDVPLLAASFLERTAERTGRRLEGFSRGALEILARRPWPGNIRELLNTIERAAVVYARDPVVTDADIAHALDLQAPRARVLPLNLRQRRLLARIEIAGSCTALELLRSATEAGPGYSLRSMQNDLRRLSDLGYVAWAKEGNARTYTLTGLGVEAIR